MQIIQSPFVFPFLVVAILIILLWVNRRRIKELAALSISRCMAAIRWPLQRASQWMHPAQHEQAVAEMV